jgi:hypothetical protein
LLDGGKIRMHSTVDKTYLAAGRAAVCAAVDVSVMLEAARVPEQFPAFVTVVAPASATPRPQRLAQAVYKHTRALSFSQTVSTPTFVSLHNVITTPRYPALKRMEKQDFSLYPVFH